jgi:hypothetical protein
VLKAVRERFAAKRVVAAFPPDRRSAELQRRAHGYLCIGEDKLCTSQLPDSITLPDGHMLRRPQTWF